MNEQNLTLQDISDQWFMEIACHVKESTILRYQYLLSKHILPELGNILFSAITDRDIAHFLERMQLSKTAGGHGLAEKTALDVCNLLKSIYRFGCQKQYVTGFSEKSLSVKVKKKQIRVLSRNEEERLYQYLRKQQDSISQGILLCMFTGIRIGELCALTWSDILLREESMRIDKTMQRLKDRTSGRTKVVISEPKSESSVRTIPLPGTLMPALRESYGSGTYVLTGKKKEFAEPRTVQYRFKMILASCGIEDVNFHVLRHTFATRCVEAGCDIKSLSEILGHADVQITMNKYVHPSMDLKRENIDRVARRFAESY